MIATYNTPEAQVYLIQRGYTKHILDGSRFLIVTIDNFNEKIHSKMYVTSNANNVHSFKKFKVKLEQYEKERIKAIKMHHEWDL